FRNPDGTFDQSIVCFEVRNGEKQLNYYYRDEDDNSWNSDPQWTISTKPNMVDFDNSTGLLLVTLTGPKGEEITYSGNPD
ncbi:MAG: hypothetical protein AAGA96_20365, partial [Verrucomicrobiota bacterium]